MVSGVRPWKLSNMDLESYRPKLNEKESSLSIHNALKIETKDPRYGGNLVSLFRVFLDWFG